MNKNARIKAALAGAEVDRVPLSFWLHFPDIDFNGPLLAERLIEFNDRFDLDFIKVMPSGLYTVVDWGCEIKRFNNPYDVPIVVNFAINSPADWDALSVLDVCSGAWGEETRALEVLADQIGGEVPFVETIFSPLTTAFKLAGEKLFDHVKDAPDILHKGLEVITQTTVSFVEAACQRGISGIFFATQCATSDWMSLDAYDEFGKRYDLQVLSALGESTYLNILHIHGSNTYFKELSNYPVSALNWHDRLTYPSLSQARELTSKCLIGGINESDVVEKSNSDVMGEVRQAIENNNGKGLIIAPGCVLPTRIPQERLKLLRESVG